MLWFVVVQRIECFNHSRTLWPFIISNRIWHTFAAKGRQLITVALQGQRMFLPFHELFCQIHFVGTQ